MEPAFRKYSKLSDVMRFTVGGLGQTGHFIKWSNEALEFVRCRGRAWLWKEKKELYQQLKNSAFDTLYPTVRPFTLQHFKFSFLCLAVGSMSSVISFVRKLIMKQLLNSAAFVNRPNGVRWNSISGTCSRNAQYWHG